MGVKPTKNAVLTEKIIKSNLRAIPANKVKTHKTLNIRDTCNINDKR